MKAWKHKCELQLLVCEPNPLRPDRVTVGFVLRDLLTDPPKVEVRLASDLRRIQCIYPEADVEAIQGTLHEMESVLKNVTDFESFMQHLPADFPGDFALLPGRAVLTDSMQAEVELLEEQYLTVASRRIKLGAGDSGADGDAQTGLEENETGRAYIRRKMQEAFVHFDVLKFMYQDISLHDYTFKGDPLRIDFAYTKRDGTYRMLHAVSLVTGLDKAKILALSGPFIKEGLQKAKHQCCEIFAIVENDKYTQSELAQNARRWMLGVGMNVQPVSSIMHMAQQARMDLGL